METILRDVAEVDEKAMARITRQLRPARKGEKELGTLHSLEGRRLYVLSVDRYKALADKALHSAAFQSDSDEEEAGLKQEAARYSSLHDVALAMFWHQAKDDTGGSAWTSSNVGVRAGWMLVVSPNPNPLGNVRGISISGISGLLGGPQEEEEGEEESPEG